MVAKLKNGDIFISVVMAVNAFRNIQLERILKMRKILNIILSFTLLLTGMGTIQANAEVNEKLVIELDEIKVSTEYDADHYFVKYYENETQYCASIYSLENNQLVDSFSLDKQVSRASNEYIRTFTNKKVEISASGETITWATEIKLLIWASGSFAQINALGSTTAYVATQITKTSMVGGDTSISVFPPNNVYPSTSVSVSSSVSLVYTYQQSSSSGSGFQFQITDLIQWGWENSYSTGDTTYYNKRCHNNYTITVG